MGGHSSMGGASHMKIGYRSNMWGWLPHGYPRSVLKTGLGRFVVQLQRLTFNFCRTYEGSFGVRQYIENDLLNFANDNPSVVVYLRPVYHKAPYLIGEYLNGRRAAFHVDHYDRSEINRWVNYLRTRSGQRIVRFVCPQQTQHPSIQGFWDPFQNLPTNRNIIEYPNDEIGSHVPVDSSATERLLEMIRRNKPGNVQILDDADEETQDGDDCQPQKN